MEIVREGRSERGERRRGEEEDRERRTGEGREREGEEEMKGQAVLPLLLC